MKKFVTACLLWILALPAWSAGEGLISLESSHDVDTTMDRLEALLTEKGMTVFVRVDHMAGAEKAGMELRPTQMLLFGNPKVGTPLILCSQTVAIDLPQKALVWQAEDGKVWLGYNDPAYLAHRHNIQGCDPVLAKVSQALANFAGAAVAPD